MQPQYPYPYNPPVPPQRHSALDITLTVIFSAIAGVAALTAVSFSFFFVMATDSCGGSHQCNFDALGAAYLATWGGIGVAILVGAVGIIVAAVRHRLMWIWPASALVLIGLSTGVGVSLANSVMHHS